MGRVGFRGFEGLGGLVSGIGVWSVCVFGFEDSRSLVLTVLRLELYSLGLGCFSGRCRND